MKKVRLISYISTLFSYFPVFVLLWGTLLSMTHTSNLVENFEPLWIITFGLFFIEVWLNFVFIPVAAAACLITILFAKRLGCGRKDQIIALLLLLSLLFPIIISYGVFYG